MNIKELYRIWEESGFKDRDIESSFKRSINTRVVIALIIENEILKDRIEDISESGCLSELSETLNGRTITQ